MTEVGIWFEKCFERYSPFRGISVDDYVCHEIGAYYGGYENAVEDGYYEEFPLHRSDALSYAYNLYMQILPKGVRYQTKAHYEVLAEKVVKGMEDAWNLHDAWCPEDKTVPCLMD